VKNLVCIFYDDDDDDDDDFGGKILNENIDIMQFSKSSYLVQYVSNNI